MTQGETHVANTCYWVANRSQLSVVTLVSAPITPQEKKEDEHASPIEAYSADDFLHHIFGHVQKQHFTYTMVVVLRPVLSAYHHLVSFPDCTLRARWKNGSGQLPNSFSFKCAGMLGHCSFLI